MNLFLTAWNMYILLLVLLNTIDGLHLKKAVSLFWELAFSLFCRYISVARRCSAVAQITCFFPFPFFQVWFILASIQHLSCNIRNSVSGAICIKLVSYCSMCPYMRMHAGSFSSRWSALKFLSITSLLLSVYKLTVKQ